MRKHILSIEPRCLRCGARATVIDHIQPHRGDPSLFWQPHNLQPLCKPCHDSKTATEDSRFAAGGRQRAAARCGEDGQPIDPQHPWNRR